MLQQAGRSHKSSQTWMLGHTLPEERRRGKLENFVNLNPENNQRHFFFGLRLKGDCKKLTIAYMQVCSRKVWSPPQRLVMQSYGSKYCNCAKSEPVGIQIRSEFYCSIPNMTHPRTKLKRRNLLIIIHLIPNAVLAEYEDKWTTTWLAKTGKFKLVLSLLFHATKTPLFKPKLCYN